MRKVSHCLPVFLPQSFTSTPYLSPFTQGMNNETITKQQFQDTGSHLTAKIRHAHKPTRYRRGKANARGSTRCAPMPRKCISCVPRALLHVSYTDTTKRLTFAPPEQTGKRTRRATRDTTHPPHPRTHTHTHTHKYKDTTHHLSFQSFRRSRIPEVHGIS